MHDLAAAASGCQDPVDVSYPCTSRDVPPELSNISVVRPREVWFSLGGACLAVGTILSALAVGYFVKEQRYSLGLSPLMIWSYVSFALAFLFFVFAIAGWGPWLRWQGFPDITVLVQGSGQSVATRQIKGFPPIPTSLIMVKVFFINGDHDRNVCALGRHTCGAKLSQIRGRATGSSSQSPQIRSSTATLRSLWSCRSISGRVLAPEAT